VPQFSLETGAAGVSHFSNKSAFEIIGIRSGRPAEAWLAETAGQKPGTENRNAMARGEAVVRRAKHFEPFHFLLRANRIVVLTVLWAALAACIVGALAFDLADWLSAWRT
jgi:hypothetical protein